MSNEQTRQSLASDIWRACDILRRDNNCGGVMEYVEHLSWLLFLRFLDAQDEEWETQAHLAGRPPSADTKRRLKMECMGKKGLARRGVNCFCSWSANSIPSNP